MLEVGFYKELLSETIVEIISINEGVVRWRTLNKKKFDGHIFEDKMSKIKTNYLEKLKNFEKN